MKKERIIEILDLADDKYIDECAPKKTGKRMMKNKRISLFVAAVVSLMLLVGVSAWLFIPYSVFEDVAAEYKNDEYYEVIKKYEEEKKVPHVSNARFPIYNNNFEKHILSKIRSEKWFENPIQEVEFSVMEGNTVQKETYIEVTDNQVDTIIESDYLKRTDKYAYYGNCGLSVIKYDGENTEVVAYNKEGKGQIILTEDCSTVIEVADGALWLFDVSDAENVKLKGKIVFSGGIQSARLYGDKLLITVFDAQREEVDYADKDTYVPYAKINNEKKYISSNDITVAEYSGWRERFNYTSVWMFDAKTFEYMDSKSVFGPVGQTELTEYVTKDRIYLVYSYYEESINDRRTVFTEGRYTDIRCYSYNEEEIKSVGGIKLNCTVTDRYQMNEKDGVLRVAADTYERVRERNGSEVYFDYFGESKRDAVVLCIDTDSWKVIGKIDGFMPENESVKSVRFEGDKCYVCTAKVVKKIVTDPVFCFDLSNPKKITYKDTGEIKGYSSSLVQIGDYLLGIGVGDKEDIFKLELYKETEDALVSVDTYLAKMENVSASYPGYSQDYKDYYIDKDNFLVGFWLNSGYTLLSCRDGQFKEIFKKEIKVYSPANATRGFYNDGWFYLFACNDETVIPVKVDIE